MNGVVRPEGIPTTTWAFAMYQAYHRARRTGIRHRVINVGGLWCVEQAGRFVPSRLLEGARP